MISNCSSVPCKNKQVSEYQDFLIRSTTRATMIECFKLFLKYFIKISIQYFLSKSALFSSLDHDDNIVVVKCITMAINCSCSL